MLSFVKPSDIFAKLLAAIPDEIPTAKNKYPNKGFIFNYCPSKLTIKTPTIIKAKPIIE